MDAEKIKALMEERGFKSVEIKIFSRYFRVGERPENYMAVKTPLPGIFYRAPAPNADPFVREGDKIEVGSTVCIVEAMKVFNEIESEFEGIVAEICAQNQQIVKLDDTLMFIEQTKRS